MGSVIHQSVLEMVGNTPLVRLDRYFKGARCTVLGKCDFMNPAGSVKDRIGRNMIERAEEAGLIKPGGTIVEATAGNTGLGLCIAAAVKGYKVVCCTPDKMSQEKINLMRAFGARVVVTPTVPKEDPRSYTAMAKKIASETPNALYIAQFENDANPEAHYLTTGPELWEQTEGKINVFVASSGTGGTLKGAGKYLKEKSQDVQIVLGDPEGSIYAHYAKYKNLDGETASYKVEGIGNDYLPATVDLDHIDHTYTVSDRESFNASRRLALTEGLFCGGSSGTNLVAAMRYIREFDPGEDVTLVVFLCDTGERYLSKIYNDDWMRENQFMSESGVGMTAADLLVEKQASATGLITAAPDTPVAEVFAKIKSLDISQVPVIEDSRVVGALNENQVLDLLMQGKALTELVVRDVMGEALLEVEPETTVQDMLKVMRERNQDAVMVRQGSSFDILTKFDLLRAL